MKEPLIERFEKHGYAILPDIVAKDEISPLREMLLSEMKGREEIKTGAGSLLDVLVKYPAIFQIMRNREFTRALTEILGEGFLVVPHSSAALNSFGQFHTDTTAPELDSETFPREPGYRLVTVGIYLQDNGEDGGGLRVVPGSHQLPDPFLDLMREKQIKSARYKKNKFLQFLNRLTRYRLFDFGRPFQNFDGEVNVPSTAGDAVVFDMRLIHSASHPQRPGDPLPYHDKLAIFFTCGRDNEQTQSYLKWMRALPANAYVNDNRVIDEKLQEESLQLGFKLV